MKQKIYEIPVWEAFEDNNSECALCSLEKRAEDNFIDALFTEMVMDVRLNPQLVKDYDFCHDHFEKLYRFPDKCGLAVLTNRILMSKRAQLKTMSSNNFKSRKISIKDMFLRKDVAQHGVKIKKCLLCSKVEADMENYVETFILLWSKEDKFRKLVADSRGFCLNHQITALDFASRLIKNESLFSEFEEKILGLQEDNMARIQEELEWFISKFDYRYTNESWKTSKDALIRTIQKLIGNYNTKI